MKPIVTLIMMLLSAAAYGQLLKCIGRDGRIEYANVCPSGSKQEDTGIRNTPASTPASPATSQKSLAEQDAEFRKRLTEKKEAEAKAAKKETENAERSRACEDARAYLKSLQAGNRIAKVDPNTGERAFLEDSQYATEMAAAQRAIDTNCK